MDSKPTESLSVVVALIGLAGTLVTTVGTVVMKWLEYKSEKEKSRSQSAAQNDEGESPSGRVDATGRRRRQKTRRWTHLLLAFVGLTTVGGAASWWQQSYATREPALKITYPAAGAEVSMREEVEGTYENLPDGQVVWVVVYSHASGRYYPQNDPAELQRNGRWTSLVYFGVEADRRQTFDALAVLADAKGQASIRSYLAEARDRNDWPGLDRWPQGVILYDRVKVARR
jgi:hypothetical protein